MSKRDELLRAGADHIRSSMGSGTEAGLPAGLDPGSAVRRPAHLDGLTKDRAAARIALDRIVRDPTQPREEFDPDALERLAESLKSRGQLQPIRVRWDGAAGVYVVVVGERRWRAARMAGLTDLSCVVDDAETTPDERLMVQLVENALREDLRPVEQAKAYRALMDAKGWSGNQLAKELHVAQSSVVRTLALLELPAAVQGDVDRGALAATAAAEIARLSDPADQTAVADMVVAGGLNRSEVAEVVAAVKARRPAAQQPSRPEPLTLDLGGVVVVIKWKRGGEGTTAGAALKKALKVLAERDGRAA